jgi:1-acyl-sn-glycerol-3-phosphate acyltransferase
MSSPPFAQAPSPAAAPVRSWGDVPLGVWRLTRVVMHILGGLTRVYISWGRLSPAQRREANQRWASQLLRLLGITLVVDGQPHAGGKLIVANHVSWLDIMAINATHPSRFVSKAEVGQWPLIGRLVTAADTLYLVREKRRDAKRVLGLMSEALRQGDTVAVFPEGTTGSGHHVMHFHGNLLQSAIDAEVPVQPVAIRYRDRQHEVSVAAAYIGDATLVQSLWWVVTARELTVHVRILPAQSCRHADRRALAELLRQQIGEQLPTSVRA